MTPPYQIERIPTVQTEFVLQTALEGWLELMKSDYCSPDLLILSWDNPCVIVRGHGVGAESVCGVIVYALTEWNKTLYINLGYVRPSHRKLGLYKMMYQELIGIARSKDMKKIRGSIASENIDARRMAISLGRSEVGVIYETVIEP